MRRTLDTIFISEVFGPVLQGEGALIGRPTVFVRTGGCDFRCAWCDTLYAVLPEHKGEWKPQSADEILAQVEALSGGAPVLITLSGGNPALQPLETLLDAGHVRGHTFAMETQGSVARDWFSKLDYLILSPKPPSSGMKHSPAKLKACLAAARKGNPQISLKVVVFDEDDYQFARAVNKCHPEIPFYLQVGNPSPEGEIAPEMLLGNLRRLGERVLADGWQNVAVLPQLHVLMYGNKRGV
jgi:7-carboxy-7-deazaguanine synthase